MAQEPNRLLRIIVPLALLASGVAYFIYVAIRPPQTPPSQTPPAATTPANTPTAAAKAADEKAGEKKADGTAAATDAKPAEAAPPPAQPAAPPVATQTPAPSEPKTYRARLYPLTPYQPIGSTKPKSDGGTHEMELRFSAFGAGLDRLSLANHFTTIQHTHSEPLQQFTPVPAVFNPDPRAGIVAFAADGLQVNGTLVGLRFPQDTPRQTFWKEVAPGTVEAEIIDDADRAIARVQRTFSLAPGQYEFTLTQTITNLTDQPMRVVWKQFGPASLPAGTIRYGGDVRRVRFGFIWPPDRDTARTVVADDRGASLVPYATALGNPSNQDQVSAGTALPVWDPHALWPNADSEKNKLALAWAGVTSRYFTVAMYPKGASPLTNPGAGADKVFSSAASIDRLAVSTGHVQTSGIGGFLAGRPHLPIGEMVLRLTTPEMTIEPGKVADVSLGVYAGPSHKELIEQQPGANWAGIPQIVLFTFGGPCGFCTFQGIAGLLRNVLNFLHDYVVFDWALAIMLLVVCVRTVLHPITRWSQKSLYKFGKEMSKLGPKQKAIQEKYKDDPTKMREEMGRLMKEEGVSYTGALGCIPAFLQTPVWIGLSAMIYFAFDLRHQHAFFGVFQNISNHKWGFLGDLAEPDQLIAFGTSFNVPVISSFMGPIDGLNIVPLLLGVVFYIQQKYMTPPTTTPLTPEQEQQQKMMKIMTVVLFPLMMYNAPAGLALYFATNSALAIIESKWIRAKAEEEYKEKELIAAAKAAAGIKPTSRLLDRSGRNLPQKEGFLARLRRMADEAQKMREQQAKTKNKKK